MGYAEKGGDYWRGRYKIERGKYGTVTDPSGATVKFRTKREAEQAANDAEAKVRGGAWRDPAAGRITFGEYMGLVCLAGPGGVDDAELPAPHRGAPAAGFREPGHE